MAAKIQHLTLDPHQINLGFGSDERGGIMNQNVPINPMRSS